MSTESDWKAVELSFDLLEGAEIVQEFEDDVWLKVDKATWYEFIGNREQSKEDWACGT